MAEIWQEGDEYPTTNYVHTALGIDWNGRYGHLGWRGKYEAEMTIDDMDGMILVEDKEDECTAAIFSSRRTNLLLYTKPRVRYLGLLLNRHMACTVVE